MSSIETDRLILREWKSEDLKPFAAINRDPHVMEFFLKPLSEAEAAEMIDRFRAKLKRDGFGLLACVLKETSELIGFVGLDVPNFEASFTPCVEIGWRLAHHVWGKGYATEAACAVLKAGFEQYGLKEIVSFTVPMNCRSRRVMEKIGMLHDAREDFHHPKVPLEHPLSLHVIYRMTKDRYENVKDLIPFRGI